MALGSVYGFTNEADVGEFLAKPPPAESAEPRVAIIEKAFAALRSQQIPLDKSPDDPSVTDGNERLLYRSIRALRNAASQANRLSAQLASQRATLRNRLHGKAVIIGAVVTQMDLRKTSIHPKAPGVIVYGTILNGILTHEGWRTLPGWVTTLATIVCGLAATACVGGLSPRWSALAAALLLAGFLAFNAIALFDYGNLILGVAGPVTAIGLAWAGGTLTRLFIEGRERARVTRRFKTYVDPKLVDYVLANPGEAALEGQMREMTVVFTDLTGFTAMSNRLGEQIIPLLNEFMGLVSAIITAHNGLVNKFLGDGVMFFFNAPALNLDHAPDAIHTVLAIEAMLVEFNQRLAVRGLPAVGLRAGVSTGRMVVGDAGSRDRSDYTVLGDYVNLAARLESANKATGTANLVTDRTVELCRERGADFLFRPIAPLQVVGLPEAVMTYEVLAPAAAATEEQKAVVELSESVVRCFRAASPSDCLTSLERLEARFGRNKVTALYREKCTRHLDGEPTATFDCQIALTEK